MCVHTEIIFYVLVSDWTMSQLSSAHESFGLEELLILPTWVRPSSALHRATLRLRGQSVSIEAPQVVLETFAHGQNDLQQDLACLFAGEMCDEFRPKQFECCIFVRSARVLRCLLPSAQSQGGI